jgi:hypothetical protein
MRDELVNHTRDAMLAQLFAKGERALPDTEFLKQLLSRVEREQRRRQIYVTIALVFVLGLLALLAPWISESAANLVALGNQAANAIGSAVQSPIAWIIGAALVFAFAPLIYVSRWWQID